MAIYEATLLLGCNTAPISEVDAPVIVDVGAYVELAVEAVCEELWVKSGEPVSGVAEKANS